jgi:hypothetical protein
LSDRHFITAKSTLRTEGFASGKAIPTVETVPIKRRATTPAPSALPQGHQSEDEGERGNQNRPQPLARAP